VKAENSIDSELELTILIPCLNEAPTIGVCVAKGVGYLSRASVSGEVLVADNGSTDGSREIAAAAGARVVPVPERGYGAALIGGITAARGRYIIMGDADNTYDLAALDPFVARLRGGADLVMGNRFQGGIAPGAMPWLHRYLGNPVLSFFGRLFFRIPVGDFHCGLRGFNARHVRALDLQATGMEFASEMIVRSALVGSRIEEVATTLQPSSNLDRVPHLRTWRDGWRHLRFLLLLSPRWLFIVPGLIVLLLGLVGVVALLGGPVRIAGIEFDINTFAASIMATIIGFQALSFGFIARRYASHQGLLPTSERYNAWLNRLSLETALLLALGLFLVGSVFAFGALGAWVRAGFGELHSSQVLRVLLLGLGAMTIAVQAAFSAFLAGVLEMPLKNRTTTGPKS
jgi:hypothetical protein